MKVVIFAGGYGTRLSEETGVRPKPMVEVGGRPILWHIMKSYSHYGFDEFVILCGYKSHIIKEYFANYHLHKADVTFDLTNHTVQYHKNGVENWKVTLVETGENTMTGGRLKQVIPYVNGETFLLTYGDGLTDLPILKTIEYHKKHNALCTLTAVQPPGRFGSFKLDKNQTLISHFKEKPKGDGAWINGGYFVVEPQALELIKDNSTVWEEEPMRELATKNKLIAYKHDGFWQNMDTLRDKIVLEDLWKSGKAPWKVWTS